MRLEIEEWKLKADGLLEKLKQFLSPWDCTEWIHETTHETAAELNKLGNLIMIGESKHIFE